MVAITYRGNGAWGVGKGSNLEPSEVDVNFYHIATALTNLAGQIGSTVGIDYFEVVGDQMIVHMDDHTTRGPYTLPVVQGWNPVGVWLAGSTYNVNDVTTVGNNLYLVLVAHTADSTFDPNATDGSGHNLYKLILTFPGVHTQAKTGTTFVPAFVDASTYNRMTNAAGCTIVIPDNATVPFPIDTEIHFRQASAGFLYFSAFAPAVLNPVVGYGLFTQTEGSTVTIKKVGADEWDIFGLLAAAPSSPGP